MPTKKHRYMIVLDEASNNQLNVIMKEINTKQKSKAIAYLIKNANLIRY